MRNEAEAVFGLVSVVQIARESSAKERAERAAIPASTSESAQNLFHRELYADHTRANNKDFLRLKSEPSRSLFQPCASESRSPLSAR